MPSWPKSCNPNWPPSCSDRLPIVDVPTEEALYITSAEEIAWGIILVAATLIIHAMGMILTQTSVTNSSSRSGSGLGNSLSSVARFCRA